MLGILFLFGFSPVGENTSHQQEMIEGTDQDNMYTVLKHCHKILPDIQMPNSRTLKH